MNGYDSVNLCKPALHSGKGLPGGLSSLFDLRRSSLHLRVGERLDRIASHDDVRGAHPAARALVLRGRRASASAAPGLDGLVVASREEMAATLGVLE